MMPAPAPLLTVVPGNVVTAWCYRCKAWTRLDGQLLLLAAEGVSTVGTWSWCEICEDPSEQEVPRRGGAA
ncbi:hypothetical protein ABZ312_09585 [Streptomyces sp. NPDC006207]|nr:hypothetical protein [Streptomyces sp. PA03-5A]